MGGVIIVWLGSSDVVDLVHVLSSVIKVVLFWVVFQISRAIHAELAAAMFAIEVAYQRAGVGIAFG